MRPHQMCGITEPHNAHAFASGEGMTQLLYACPGVPHPPIATEAAPGPCWHDSGITWPGETYSVRCDLRAGHAGAHEADRGQRGGTAVWTDEETS